MVGGVIFQQSRKKYKTNNVTNSNSSIYKNPNEEISDAEKNAKQYIESYKSQYSKDAIKTGLINTGISDVEAEIYLSKYM